MAKKTIKTDTETITFEVALKHLETIVERLESGQVPLDETIQSFEEGMKLVERCHQQLNHAESKLKRLVRNKAGMLETEEMEFNESDS
jgi:exodeoxyribonuclease VII small subunit